MGLSLFVGIIVAFRLAQIYTNQVKFDAKKKKEETYKEVNQDPNWSAPSCLPALFRAPAPPQFNNKEIDRQRKNQMAVWGSRMLVGETI